MDLNLTAAQSVTMESLRIGALRINGLPVYAAPLNQEIVFKKGVITALPPLYVTVLFRDLHTVEPLKRMMENQSVKIEGEVVADLRLNMVEKLALHTQHPTRRNPAGARGSGGSWASRFWNAAWRFPLWE